MDEIPLSDWMPRYSPDPIIKSIRANPAASAVLQRNRGLFAWGKNTLLDLANLLNDNGSAYRAHTLQGICARLGIHLIYCRPYAPEGKGC